MKKIITAIIFILLIPAICFAGEEIYKLTRVYYPILINNVQLKSNLPILNYNGNTYIPLGSVSESMGADVEWDNENKRVNIYTDYYGLTTKEIINSIDYTVKIDDHVYTLSTKIHRDLISPDPFMTTYGVNIFLTTDNKNNFADNFDIDKVLIICNDIVYELPHIPYGFSKEEKDGNFILYKHIPAFLPDSVGKRVDVIVRIVDNNKNTYLLRAIKQGVYITQY